MCKAEGRSGTDGNTDPDNMEFDSCSPDLRRDFTKTWDEVTLSPLMPESKLWESLI